MYLLLQSACQLRQPALLVPVGKNMHKISTVSVVGYLCLMMVSCCMSFTAQTSSIKSPETHLSSPLTCILLFRCCCSLQ